jgi:hypothetical protein
MTVDDNSATRYLHNSSMLITDFVLFSMEAKYHGKAMLMYVM